MKKEMRKEERRGSRNENGLGPERGRMKKEMRKEERRGSRKENGSGAEQGRR